MGERELLYYGNMDTKMFYKSSRNHGCGRLLSGTISMHEAKAVSSRDGCAQGALLGGSDIHIHAVPNTKFVRHCPELNFPEACA